jgi:hypothetical protein
MRFDLASTRRLRWVQLSASVATLCVVGCGSTGLPGGLDDDSNGARTSAQRGAAGAAGSAQVSAGRGSTVATTAGRPAVGSPPATGTPGRPPVAGAATTSSPGNLPGTSVTPPNPSTGTVRRDGGPPDFDPTDSPCPEGTAAGVPTVKTLEDIRRLDHCTRIVGDLNIAGHDLKDLHGLEWLAEIDGWLRVTSDGRSSPPGADPGPVDPDAALQTLDGLSNLVKVRDGVLIDGLPLTSLQGLKTLRETPSLNLSRLNKLESLTGLETVEWQSAVISQNDALQALDGLRVPPDVTSIEISANPQLTNVLALKTLQSVTNISLSALPALKNLDGLQSLKNVDGGLTVFGCDLLQDLTGFGPSISFGRLGMLGIAQNPQLRSLNGLTLTEAPLTVYIADNPVLDSLAGLLGTRGTKLGTLQLEQLPALKTLTDLSAAREANVITIQSCDGLADLRGLEQLTTVESLQLLDCAKLQTVKGLDALETVTEALGFGGLPSLTSLQNLAKLHNTARLEVRDTGVLVSLAGLEQLTQLGALRIENNLKLQSIDGLSAVEKLQTFQLIQNPALTSLAAFAKLRAVDALIAISNNAALVSLSGLEQLERTPALSLVQNTQLNSLHGLASLKALAQLDINGNTRLPQCEVEWLSKQVGLSAPGAMNGPIGPCP